MGPEPSVQMPQPHGPLQATQTDRGCVPLRCAWCPPRMAWANPTCAANAQGSLVMVMGEEMIAWTTRVARGPKIKETLEPRPSPVKGTVARDNPKRRSDKSERPMGPKIKHLETAVQPIKTTAAPKGQYLHKTHTTVSPPRPEQRQYNQLRRPPHPGRD